MYRTQEILIGDWVLPTLQPVVTVAQLRANYVQPQGDDRRIRHLDDERYRQKLARALGAAMRSQANFIVFPEYAWPISASREALRLLQEDLRDGCCCVLPFEHLTLKEYEEVLHAFPLADGLSSGALIEVRQRVDADDLHRAVVNVSMTVLRAAGRLIAVPQAKLHPAGLEQRLGRWVFAAGSVIRLVVGSQLRVATMICFDLIARDEAHSTAPRELLGDLQLDVLFIPECNPKPLHETYGRAISELYTRATWAAGNTIIVLGNVSGGTRLPALGETGRFGFSRVIGRLGAISPASGQTHLAVEGIPILEEPDSLRSINAGVRIPIKTLETLVIRGQESLARVQLPTIGIGPRKDPTAGRVHTEVRVHRYVPGFRDDWQRIAIPKREEPEIPPNQIPRSLLVRGGLIGFREMEDQLLGAIRGRRHPIWIRGGGGSGKTALAAQVLHEHFEKNKTHEVVWIDMAEVPAGEEALVEEILLRLGKSAAILEDADTQRAMLKHELERPRALVLDSMERWREEISPHFFDLVPFPSIAVVTSRRLGEHESAPMGTTLTLTALGPEDARRLVDSAAGSTVSDQLTDLLYRAMKGLPLACAWVGGLLHVAPLQGSRLVDLLRADGNAELENLFNCCVADLRPLERNVLGVLSELPAALSSTELADITGETSAAIQSAARRLEGRNLLMQETQARSEEIHTKHPFVRQFWQSAAPEVTATVRAQVARWCEDLLHRHGGDRNWRGFAHLRRQWPNVRHVLDALYEKRDHAPFLDLWRRADYFLWSAGRWRERIVLGRRAAATSEELGERALLAHALYDSVAETSWHRRGTRKECEPLLDQAGRIFDELGDRSGRAKVEYYRGRMLRHMGDWDEALNVARHAVDIARAADDAYVVGLALNGLANVHRDHPHHPSWEEARRCYAEARSVLEAVQPQDEEMLAVTDRNLGRVCLQQGQVGTAIDHLEKSMDAFHQLDLPVEEAEAAVHYAKALAQVDEHEDAAEQVEWAVQTLDRLGSRARSQEVRLARSLIREAARREA